MDLDLRDCPGDTHNSTATRVKCTISDGIAEVILDRPKKMNALDPAMFEELIRTGQKLRKNPAVRAVVLAGSGSVFCAGLDFEIFAAMKTAQDLDALLGPPMYSGDGPARARGQQAAYIWTEIEAPVIAAVHGAAFGGGLQLALGADIRIVGPDTKLSVMEIKWGLVPDMTGTQVLPNLIGRDRAKELTFTGRVVDGHEAVSIGLATQTADDPLVAARTLARNIAQKNPDAIRAAKELINVAGVVPLDRGLAAEQEAIRRLIGSPRQVQETQAHLPRHNPRS